MTRHARTGSQQAAVIDDDFADRFAVLGPPAHCIARLRELLGLGLERLIVVGASLGADRAQARACEARFTREVLPALRGTA
jgi:5,10-methylenetetrahydromethanopterin reductase